MLVFVELYFLYSLPLLVCALARVGGGLLIELGMARINQLGVTFFAHAGMETPLLQAFVVYLHRVLSSRECV